MLKNAKLIAFAATTSPDRARTFYEKTLGLKLLSEDPFAIVFDAHGIMLRVQKVQEHSPAGHTLLGWDVPNIAAQVADLTKRGVRFQQFEGLQQDKSGTWSSPSGAKIAWFKDPDGNILSLTQFA